MNLRSLIVGMAVLSLLGAGSASVLNSFGTISGTASVDSALKVTAVGNTSSSDEAYVNLTSQTVESVEIDRVFISDAEKNFDSLGNPDSEVIKPGDQVVITSDEVDGSKVESWFGTDVLHLTTNSSSVGGVLDKNGDTVNIRIDDNIVDSYSYGDAE